MSIPINGLSSNVQTFTTLNTDVRDRKAQLPSTLTKKNFEVRAKQLDTGHISIYLYVREREKTPAQKTASEKAKKQDRICVLEGVKSGMADEMSKGGLGKVMEGIITATNKYVDLKKKNEHPVMKDSDVNEELTSLKTEILELEEEKENILKEAVKLCESVLGSDRFKGILKGYQAMTGTDFDSLETRLNRYKELNPIKDVAG